MNQDFYSITLTMKKLLMSIGVCKVVSIHILSTSQLIRTCSITTNLSKFQSFHGYGVWHILRQFLKIQTNLLEGQNLAIEKNNKLQYKKYNLEPIRAEFGFQQRLENWNQYIVGIVQLKRVNCSSSPLSPPHPLLHREIFVENNRPTSNV